MNTNSEESLDAILARNCPNMKPTKSVPALFNLYGFGLSLYGQRDVDQETGTYVKTHVITLLFLPILAIGAYRVANAEQGGWYFLGKEPVSGFCKGYNVFSILAIVGLLSFIGWNGYTSSPTYLSGKAMESGQAALAEDRYTTAAETFQDVIDNEWPDKDTAASELQSAYDEGLRSDSAKEIAGLVGFVPKTGDKALADMALKMGKRAIDKFSDTDLMGSADILKNLRYLAPVDNELLTKRITILERIIGEQPENNEAKVELAEVYHDSADYEKAVGLLEPIQDDLEADSMGALFLGKSFSQLGNYAKGIPILRAYVDPKIEILQKAEKNYTTQSERAYKKAYDKLDSGDGPSSFYSKLEKASDKEQGLIVSEQINSMMEKDNRYMSSITDYQEANTIVPHAFDLGISQLFFARTLPAGDEQKQGLEEAENTFLSLQGSAGESDEYRLFLGQVKYWLGKESEGETLFTQMLETNKRSPGSLMMVGQVLRELGERHTAGAYFEEAYDNAKDPDKKKNAATMKALTVRDAEEQLKWLERTDTSNPETQVRIATAKARLAEQDGDTDEAIKHMRAAVAGYEKMGDDDSTLNNRGLAYQELFGMTGDPADYEKGANEMARALELKPNDGIVVSNALSTLITSAIIKTLAEHFDFKALKGNYSKDMLQMLYDDQAGYDALTKKLVSIPEFERARPLSERARLIAPKSPSSHTLAMEFHRLAQEHGQVADVAAGMEGVDFDVTKIIEETKEMWQATDQDENREQLKIAIQGVDKLLAGLDKNSIEYAYQALERAEYETSFTSFGGSKDLQKHLDIAEAIRKQRPSRYADSVVYDLRLAMADQSLREIPAYKKAAETTIHSLSEGSRICWALLQNDELTEAMIADANLKAAYEIKAEHVKKLPKNHSVYDWALLQAFDPAAAKEVKTEIDGSGGRENKELLSGKALNPIGASTVITEYILTRMSGNKTKAEAVLKAGKDKGIPLP